MESAPSSAVPVRAIAQDGLFCAVEVPVACQVIAVPLIVPLAVPATFNPPAQVALNEPDAEVGVCCVGVHTKLVQVDGEGTGLKVADCHFPTSDSTDGFVAVGVVGMVVFDSYPTHADAAVRTTTAPTRM